MATRIRSPISPMSGHSPATRRLAIRTGSWLAPAALTETRRLARFAFAVIAAALLLVPLAAFAARHLRHAHQHPPASRSLPYPRLAWPLQISGSQYAPLAWSEIAGWNDDDHLAAYQAFRTSCRPIAAQTTPPADPKALRTSLPDPRRLGTDRALPNAHSARSVRRSQGEALLRGLFSAVEHLAAWRRRGFCFRLLRACHRRLTDPDRRLQCAGLL